MMTAATVTLLTIASFAPVASAAPGAETDSTAAPVVDSVAGKLGSTLATALPTPGAWTLMGLGGLALIRARRVKR